jgi:hypothetical protein
LAICFGIKKQERLLHTNYLIQVILNSFVLLKLFEHLKNRIFRMMQ